MTVSVPRFPQLHRPPLPLAAACALFFAGLFSPLKAAEANAPAPKATAPAVPVEQREVSIDPSKTYITAIRVTLSAGTFHWDGSDYTATYKVRVFPLFFFNESGQIKIFVTPKELDKLRHGKPISFTGKAINNSHAPRRVKGTATPDNADKGAIKIAVYVDRIKLSFKTRYAFIGATTVGSND